MAITKIVISVHPINGTGLVCVDFWSLDKQGIQYLLLNISHLMDKKKDENNG